MKKICESFILLALIVVAAYVGRNKLAVFYSNQGVKYYNRALYKEAVDSFKKSITINPSVSLVYDNLALAYVEAGLDDKAIEAYQKTMDFVPKSTNAYLGLSKIYRRRQMYQEALDMLRQSETYFPSNQDVKTLSADISFEYMSNCLVKGVDAFLAQDKQKAQILLNKAVQIKPDFAYAYYALGFFYYAERKISEAQINLNKALEIDSRLWPAYKLLGDICSEKGNYEEAINKYGVAINITNNNAALYNDLGLALMQVERYKEASVYLKTAAKLEPENLTIRYNLGNVYRDAAMFAEAISEYEKIIEHKTDFQNIHNDLAFCFSKQGKDKAALQEYSKELDYSLARLSAEPNNVTVLNSAAIAHNGIGDPKKAEEIIKKAISIQPNFRDNYLVLAKIQEELGNKTEALVALEQAKKLSVETHFIDRDIARITKEYLQK